MKGEGEGESLDQTPRLSNCGGFGAEEPERPDWGSYCAAEVLRWHYDEASQTLSLSDERVLLNCCGEHEISVELVNDVYVVQETDAPDQGARCYCMCVFDFAVEVEGVPTGTIDLRILRDITDDAQEEQLVFEGQLDLGADEGVVELDASDVGMWCEEEHGEELDQVPRASGCGGFVEDRDPPDLDSYCESEVLHWEYDEVAETLDLSDERILLNGCGEYALGVELVERVYVFRQIDSPDESGARCACMCVFDFAVEVHGIPLGVIDLRILRDITDDEEGALLVFEGQLDLSQGDGAVELDGSDVGPWCNEQEGPQEMQGSGDQ